MATYVQSQVWVLSCQNPKDRFTTTVKYLNFRTPENFAVIYLQTKRQNRLIFRLKDANGIANSEDPDQTAPRGAV